jgi:hypothetical protein
MNSQFQRRAGAMALAIAVSLGGSPAVRMAPATAPASRGTGLSTDPIRIETPVRTHYENGEPLKDFFTALAVRYCVVVIQPEGLDVYVLRSFDLPATVGDALAIARQTLEPQGYSIVQKVSDGHVIIRVLRTEEAKKIVMAESPLSFGTKGEAIDISDPTRLVTHLFPVNHEDMADILRRNAAQDPEVSAEITGGGGIGTNLILRGPALKVQRAVETLAKLDKPTEERIVARTAVLQHMEAQSAADALNEVFSRGTSPMKAVADRRTNSIVVTGPEDQVMEVMVGLVSQDAKEARVASPRGASGVPAPRPPQPPVPSTAPASPDTAPAGSPGANATTGRDRLLAAVGGWRMTEQSGPHEAILRAAPATHSQRTGEAGRRPTEPRKGAARGLDETAADGDNVEPTSEPEANIVRLRFSLFVNKDAILTNREQLSGTWTV